MGSVSQSGVGVRRKVKESVRIITKRTGGREVVVNTDNIGLVLTTMSSLDHNKGVNT